MSSAVRRHSSATAASPVPAVTTATAPAHQCQRPVAVCQPRGRVTNMTLHPGGSQTRGNAPVHNEATLDSWSQRDRHAWDEVAQQVTSFRVDGAPRLRGAAGGACRTRAAPACGRSRSTAAAAPASSPAPRRPPVRPGVTVGLVLLAGRRKHDPRGRGVLRDVRCMTVEHHVWLSAAWVCTYGWYRPISPAPRKQWTKTWKRHCTASMRGVCLCV